MVRDNCETLRVDDDCLVYCDMEFQILSDNEPLQAGEYLKPLPR